MVVNNILPSLPKSSLYPLFTRLKGQCNRAIGAKIEDAIQTGLIKDDASNTAARYKMNLSNSYTSLLEGLDSIKERRYGFARDMICLRRDKCMRVDVIESPTFQLCERCTKILDISSHPIGLKQGEYK
ncbi:adenine nucleotide alpha hydrolases-likesuperfamily protein [Striga asiatica]|uniref:Adenine nucleotide alpha hydrolases-likesuperfamily protein n=1 Tax=Striga asiatica TaxID=4170 RepID=A0A5A7Q1M1_STRAF|nr:adenine nucleotide alpha hydrolases-likesuperfamily protein [Striga asiatica]